MRGPLALKVAGGYNTKISVLLLTRVVGDSRHKSKEIEATVWEKERLRSTKASRKRKRTKGILPRNNGELGAGSAQGHLRFVGPPFSLNFPGGSLLNARLDSMAEARTADSSAGKVGAALVP